ncbi:hypothetical protein SteCoe_2451 [Stentor coeruleus]|uniref:Uncharacterized protein n=1 Tax=Stentor coeruleus TaxID=5963 RepID=A0A1R2CZF8_9CILI|nr:hypothetical protein SteCoe_2451 [Stentor coeruleus]
MRMSKAQPKFPKKLSEMPITQRKISSDSSRCVSVCTKSTASSKMSPIPDIDSICNPLIGLIVKEQSCDSDVSDVSAIENPGPLLISNISSKDILTEIKESMKTPKKTEGDSNTICLSEKKSVIKNCHWDTIQKNAEKAILKKLQRKSLVGVKKKIKELKVQISELSMRASVCESELKLKEKENSDLKTMVSSLREYVSSEAVIVDKTDDSVCKTCAVF